MLFLHELGHFLIYSGAFLVVNFSCSRKFQFKHYLIGLLASIFIDLDHLFDYFMFRGFDFDLISFLSSDSFAQKAYVPLHSWELILFLFLIYIFLEIKQYKFAPFLLFIVIGVLVHIIYDVIYYDIAWGGYLFYNRVINNFNVDVLNGKY